MSRRQEKFDVKAGMWIEPKFDDARGGEGPAQIKKITIDEEGYRYALWHPRSDRTTHAGDETLFSKYKPCDAPDAQPDIAESRSDLDTIDRVRVLEGRVDDLSLTVLSLVQKLQSAASNFA